jgi:hypothetical protein
VVESEESGKVLCRKRSKKLGSCDVVIQLSAVADKKSQVIRRIRGVGLVQSRLFFVLVQAARLALL